MSLKRDNKWESGVLGVGVERSTTQQTVNTTGVYISGRKFLDI